MQIDGSIDNGLAALALIAAFVACAIFSAIRFGVVPKGKHLRDRRKPIYGAAWNLFDEKSWTDEGIRFHRQVVTFAIGCLFLLSVLYILLDWML